MGFTEVVSLCHFIMIMTFVVFLTQDLQWQDGTLYAVSSSRLKYLTPLHMGIFRTFCAAVIWITLLFVLLSRTPLYLTVLLRNGRKKMVSLLHTQRFSMFTVWCWTVQGYFFLLAAYCSFAEHFKGSNEPIAVYFPEPPSWLLNTTWVLFEISFPVSFLVSSIVTFVLIPFAKSSKLPIDNFFVLVPLLMHNANIIFMALEVVVNEIPFAIWHLPFILLYGMAYCIFSWIWNHYHGYYFYFFLDYTRPGAITWYISLMAIVGVFFLIGFASSIMMNSREDLVPSLVGYVLACYSVLSCLIVVLTLTRCMLL